jgi:hypothetical protein
MGPFQSSCDNDSPGEWLTFNLIDQIQLEVELIRTCMTINKQLNNGYSSNLAALSVYLGGIVECLAWSTAWGNVAQDRCDRESCKAAVIWCGVVI